jgi:hypothetical protein
MVLVPLDTTGMMLIMDESGEARFRMLIESF